MSVYNDAALATYGEFVSGENTASSTSLLGVFVGTGFGLGRVVNGVIDEGAHGLAWESAHLPLQGIEPSTLEDVCSGRSIESRYVREQQASQPIVRRATEIFELAGGADEVAQQILNDACVALAEGLDLLRKLTDPSVVVLGGGVGRNSRFRNRLFEELDKRTWPHSTVSVVESELGETSVLAGAAAIATRQLRKEILAAIPG